MQTIFQQIDTTLRDSFVQYYNTQKPIIQKTEPRFLGWRMSGVAVNVAGKPLCGGKSQWVDQNCPG